MIPPRFDLLGKALNSFMNQKRRADEIHVYIPKAYKSFPEHAFILPNVPDGVHIKVVKKDFGPATKILPCVLANRKSNVRIIYGDDDRYADFNWVDKILVASDEKPDEVIVSQGMTLADYGIKVKETLSPRAKKCRYGLTPNIFVLVLIKRLLYY